MDRERGKGFSSPPPDIPYLAANGALVNMYALPPHCIDIHTVATNLSRIYRFSGAIPWTVAQHSLVVAWMVDRSNALWGLLHDASEAFMGDVLSQLKTPALKDLEARLEARIWQVLGVDCPWDRSKVEEADLHIRWVESSRWLSRGVGKRPTLDRFRAIDMEIDKFDGKSHEDVAELFVERYRALVREARDGRI